ncbi:MAG TPA: hypothetical protein ENN80_08880, partial [Candidatus Hydrogenedentes bacterium]|nr:hypothetical protein [Candidatus Hydrogenedentota bacterium]
MPVAGQAVRESSMRCTFFTRMAVLVSAVCLAFPAMAQLDADDLAELARRAAEEDWTFTVGANPATERPTEGLCGKLPNPDWRTGERLARTKTELPSAFDWRDMAGCPPVRDQGDCGSCWAFSTVGAFECAILIMDGVEVDLSEQWLVSCNFEGFGCNGGLWAHQYFVDAVDWCFDPGAVLEEEFPYAEADVPCGCPYNHPYFLDSWGRVDGTVMVPDVELMKQAIYDYGPISVGVYVNNAFQAYLDGVFNAGEDKPTNHAVLLVGWDDALGAEGVWILRNSWSAEWGMSGYMYIEYGCSRVGDEAVYVVYNGADALEVAPVRSFVSRGPEGGPFAPVNQAYTVTNRGGAAITCSAATAAEWVQISTDAKAFALGPGESRPVTASIAPEAAALAPGVHVDEVLFTNETSGRTRPIPVRIQVGAMEYFVESFEDDEFDLHYKTLLLTPDASIDGFSALLEPAAAFPTDPAGGTAPYLGDDGCMDINLADGAEMPFLGESYSTLYMG